MSNIGVLAKGAFLTSTGTVNTPLPIGTDTFVLVADSGQTLGVKWAAASTGTVTSVSGTLNRITSTGGATPVIDIDASYVGQASITTLGTVATGTWNASLIGLTYGGTNANLTASNGGIFYSTATAGAILAGTATARQMLQSGASTTPAWSTTTWPATTTINRILFSSAANVIGEITTANNGVLVTSTGGVPSVLAAGTAGAILRSGAPAAWSTTTYPATNAISTLLYASAANVMSALATANNGTLVTSATGVPSILVGPGATGRMFQSTAAAAPAWSTATYPATTTSQQILYSTAANVVGELTTANSKFPATNASGTLAMRALSVVTQVFTSSGTYTPTSGMLFCVIEVLGSGGGGGATSNGAAGNAGGAGGGGAGGYARKTVSAATIGASQTVTINAAGTGGTAGANPGNAGGTVSVGAIVSATGGAGGAASTPNTIQGAAGGAGGVGSSGDFNSNGATGQIGHGSSTLGVGGGGASSLYGGGGAGAISGGAAVAGGAATVYGSGGGGASVGGNASSAAGGAGSLGIVVITEYVIA
jgi:hypothetical protein